MGRVIFCQVLAYLSPHAESYLVVNRDYIFSFFLKKIFFWLVHTVAIFIYLPVLALCCCTWDFSSCRKWGLLPSCSAQASHCSGFSCCGAWALGHTGFNSWGTWAFLFHSMWNLSRPGIEPASPALAGVFLSPVSPGKYLYLSRISLSFPLPLILWLSFR